MIQTGFEKRVKVQQIIESQLPEFILSESPKTLDFLKQYYISQEYQGGVADLTDNLDQYLKLDNLTPEVISGTTTLSVGITTTSEVGTIEVSSTKGFPSEYGLFKIDDEIFTYTGLTANSFTGCIRGFSGITSFRSDLDSEELIFSESKAETHSSGKTVENLSVGFLKEFYKKLKYTLTPGLEDVSFVSDLDVNNFIKEARSLYESKGTEESFKILFKVLYGVNAKIIDLENYLVKPSSSNYRRREVIIAESISGDPNKLIGQTITKSSDSKTFASVSEVEILNRPNFGKYYKIGLFIGFDDKDLIEGIFNIQPKTKVVSAADTGSSVITVDSTIGFKDSGTLISGNNTITYGSKTVNQFLDCQGIETAISVKDDIRSDEYFFGYENGDTTKEVRISITGVVSKFVPKGNISSVVEGQKVYVNNVGEKILNSRTTDKEIFANSWIYNTSSRFEVDSYEGTSFTLKSSVDKSSLKVGDSVDILSGTTDTVLYSNATVSSINSNVITLDDLVGFSSTADVTLRRRLKTSSSTGTKISSGNNTLTSDIQNLYTDASHSYVASNSLPSYDITQTVISSTIPSPTENVYILDYDSTTLKYGVISFETPVDFITGDEIYYSSANPLVGLSEGTYFVEVLSNPRQIKLYQSISLIDNGNNVKFSIPEVFSSHTFVLNSQKDNNIKPQKLLKKFPLARNIENGSGVETKPLTTGMLVNGVEIVNYKSLDKIYYGSLEDITIYHGGTNYDVINPPAVEVSSPPTGYTTALVTPVISGAVKEVKVDPQDFDLQDVLSVSISGGNGDGAILEPVLETRSREIEFSARLTVDGGGLNNSDDTITFKKQHYLTSGDKIIYDRNGNNPIGIGTFGGDNEYQNLDLNSGSLYYAQVVDTTTIKLYDSLSNYNSGINTVGFTTSSQGIHKFRLYNSKKTLKEVKVINPGSGYQNRKLKVKSENINPIDDTITFKNHGFNNGDVISYTSDGSEVGGLSTLVKYKIIKVSDDKFKLSNVGVGATDNTNYIKNISVDITDSGSGYQNFAYPDIEITVNAQYDGVSGIIRATPIVRGEVVDFYIYEKGTGYGSNIINYEKKPKLTVKTGKGAELLPVVSSGKIKSVYIETPGSEYFSVPDLKVVGDGIGAKLRAVVTGGKITNVIVLNTGTGYSSTSTYIEINPVGKGINIKPNLRTLTLNNHHRFGDEIIFNNNNSLQYGVVGYSTSKGTSEFGDNGVLHSPIIGWAYDGNPIYGGYGYSDPSDTDSTLKILTSGYTLSENNITDRPSTSTFPLGYFVEDYKFTNSSSDLDHHNGRYAKTPDFPNGVYAYYTPLSANGKKSVFPYFIGNEYRSLPIEQDLDQSYDFNNSTLVRNTFPYNVNEKYSNNDFISEPYEYLVQSAVIDSVSKGSVEDFIINNSGSGYKVGDSLVFDNTDTNGSGISAEVKSLEGKEITDVTTTTTSYQTSVLVRDNVDQVSVHISPSHTFSDNDFISISGLSTFVSNLTKVHKIGVTSESTRLLSEVSANSTVGFVTDIFVLNIPSSVSAGSTVSIGTERMSVLNTYPQNKVIRVVRGVTGTAHTANTPVNVSTNRFTLSVNTDYFESELNDKIYFNPTQSIGIGTTSGNFVSNSYFIGDRNRDVSVETQNVYLPNHPFKTGQQVTLEIPTSSNTISVSSTETSGVFSIPQSGTTETLFVIKKSDDFIGLCTQVGLTTNTKGLFFDSFTTNGDSSDYKYSLTSNKTQVTAKSERITSRVSVSTAHGLSEKDLVKLTVVPNQSVGIGTSTSVYVKYNSSIDKLLINPIQFTPVGVNTITNEITIPDHGFKTGDKVYYDGSMNDTEYETIGVISNPGDPLSASAQNALTDKAISPTATRTAQEIYDYFWDNYAKYDMDGDGVVSSNDALVAIKAAFGGSLYSTDALISDITFPSTATRTTASAIRSFIEGNGGISTTSGSGNFTTGYDIDGDGNVAALGDMLMVRKITNGGIGAPDSYPAELITRGLSVGFYYLYRVDDDTVSVTSSYYDAISSPPSVINIDSAGGSVQEFSLVNPKLQPTKGNDLVFDVSDSSLNGYSFNLYYDKEFKNNLISIGSSTTFNVSGVGTVGVTPSAKVTLKYQNSLPEKVYYQISKSGFISTSDVDVKGYSEISFVDSVYNGSYNVIGIGTTTFDVSLSQNPENNNYNQTSTSTLKYSTQSSTASGGVDSVKLLFGGSNYKKLPEFSSITSTNGKSADIIPTSNTIGKIIQSTISDPGFDFSADKTLSPEAYISPNIVLNNRNYVSKIDVTFGGLGYSDAPSLVLVNPSTGREYDSGVVIPEVRGSSITSVEILSSPKNLSEEKSEVYAINNSNGVTIKSCETSSSGIVTCTLSTPIAGFSTSPFAVGDQVFVEGIEQYSSTGTGFNSKDYSYKFFKVTKYTASNPDILEFDVSPYATNPGIAKTDQGGFASIVNKNVYPTFEVTQKASQFIIGEKLSVKIGNNYSTVDLVVTDTLNDSIKVYGSYVLSIGQVIYGQDSGSEATLKSIDTNAGTFEVDYSLVTNYGWSDDIGKLNEDYQVIPDNDYYQNLSYSIDSSIEYDDWVNPVNSILHSTGLKNFADTSVISEGTVSTAQTGSTESVNVIDLISEKRVDTINVFDLASDVYTSGNKSKFVALKNKRLSDYIECKTNRVLTIDNFNELFTNKEDVNSTLYKDIEIVYPGQGYMNYFVQIINPNSTEIQASEVVLLDTNLDNIVLGQKSSLHSTENIVADFEIYKDSVGTHYLRFVPKDPYNSDYDIKFVKSNFNTTISGVGTQSIGFIDLVGINTTVGVGSTGLIYQKSKDTFEFLVAEVEVSNEVTKQKTVVDLFIDHDDTNTYRSELFFDGFDSTQFSSNFIGTFTSNIDSNTDLFSLKFENNTESNIVRVRSSIVGFGTTAVGIGTYTFKASGQPDNSVREGKLESNYSVFSGSGISTVLTYDKSDITTVKSVVRVSYGDTSSVSKVLFNHNGTETYVTQYPYLDINDNLGIGTFGAEIDGSDFNLIFYPDAGIADNITFQSYSEIIQTDSDLVNDPETLKYGTINKNLNTIQFNSVNGSRTNRTNFDLNHKNYPIFEKTFNPSVSVAKTTGVFSIDNHFFKTGEQLIYTPRSSFIGSSSTSIVMSDTNILPTDVYAIRVNSNQFKLATSLSNANAGTAVTFNSLGDGNAHTLEMTKKMEKSLITIDGVARAPLAFTPINHQLSYNEGGSISAASTFFSLSGISSISPGNVLKIDNEYVKTIAVGLGTTTVGPITGIGTYTLVESQRGFVGSSATTHDNNATVRVYGGSYNIVRNQIHFTEAPRGNAQEVTDESNIPYNKSVFGGRVYLRNSYSNNRIFDDISSQFTGIGATYRLTVEGSDVTGIETGSTMLFMNNIFQDPTTSNNAGGNYSYIENSGISSIVFSGNSNNSISEYDVNQNLLPRGGLIVSLGSTQGLGFAPLVGASVTSVVSGGVIQNSIGIGTTDNVGSGYYGTVSIGVTDPNQTPGSTEAIITATVGAGGSLSFNVTNGGTGYTDTAVIQIPDPSYSNLEIVGTSRIGIGSTTDTGSGLLLNVEVGAANTNVGIGSTLFEVKNFKITRPGWGFRKGDKFKPVGLVTAKGLSEPQNDFELEVLDIFNDTFSSVQLGQFDYIDSITSLQDGVKTRFPLKYQGELVSFEINTNNVESTEIDLESILLVYINGVLQNPGETYRFEGGTSIVFAEAPRGAQSSDPKQQVGDNIDIFFYRGTRDVDSLLVTNEVETIRPGDTVQLSAIPGVDGQDQRTIFNIYSSDELETNSYTGFGITENSLRPLSWTKQKVDKVVGGETVPKTRDSIEAQVYPTARVIGDFNTTETDIYVDDARFFDYEGRISENEIDLFIVNTPINSVAAAITATVSAAGTISAFTIGDGGSGYTGSSADIKISAPSHIKVGFGTTATATATVTNGSITSVSIVNPGLGYTSTTPPQVITTLPEVSYENVLNITGVAGTTGTVTGIGTTVGTGGHALALKFTLNIDTGETFDDITGYPIYIFNTSIGSGVTSVNTSDSATVGIGTTFLDNIYIANAFTSNNNVGILTCNILSTSSTVGLETSGSATNPQGLFSWGKISGFTRSSSPISIGVTGLTVDSGLSTFPTIQRRGFGLRSNGSLRKDLS